MLFQTFKTLWNLNINNEEVMDKIVMFQAIFRKSEGFVWWVYKYVRSSVDGPNGR